MKGLFEVHLITLPEYQTQLFGYITNLRDKRLINPRPTCAHSLYGDFPVQPMLTFWITDQVDAVTEIVKEIEQDMINKKIPIIRQKIEEMAHNEGVPDECTGDHYFEFHFKVNISNTNDWNKIVELIVPYGGHLFYNPYNKSLKPIVTIRRYTSLTSLENIYKQIVTLLKENGFICEEVEREYSVYDSNVSLDKNWLFENYPTNFITTINNKMVFVN